MIHSVIIVGSGPAAHTAAIYTARMGLSPVLFEGFMAAGVAAGGQLTTTTVVENYPGFPDGISGSDLMESMRAQSVKVGAEIRTETIERVDLCMRPFKVWAEGSALEDYLQSQTLIIATGATAKVMDIPGNDTYWQKGISACAVCDGALPIFRGVPLAVVGGGDSACEEALHLTAYAEQVHMLLRSGAFRASKIMEERVRHHPKIEIHLWTAPIEAQGNGETLTGLKLKNTQTEEMFNLPARGLFYAIGHKPNTTFLDGQLRTDDIGYLMVKDEVKTNVEGVFAAGDVADPRYRQAIVAAGAGCKAAFEAIWYLQELG